MENRVTVTLSKGALNALQKSIDGMRAFAKSCEADIEKGDYHDYDYGMTDWREDIADCAEELVDSVEEAADDSA
jgi:hypothetical protein